MPASKPAATSSCVPLRRGDVEDDVGNRRANGTSLGASTIVADSGVTNKRNASRRPLAQPDDLIEEGFDFAQRGTQATDELCPSPVGATLRVVREKTNAEALFQPADRMTERGPRDAQPFRRLRKAPLFSNGQERRQHIQVVELHCGTHIPMLN